MGANMDLIKVLDNIVNETCSCGKSHKINLPKLIIENGAIEKLPKVIKELGAKKVFVLSDLNTFEVAGSFVCEILKNSKIPYVSFVFNDRALEPDEKAVKNATSSYDNTCDLILAVGSGVINDIGKILASSTKNPYVIVGTAPSMDGYASATSSMSVDGLKVSLPSKSADVIIGDLQILKNAPLRMLQAGLGDMLAKYVSILEWRIANIITGEYYCEKIASLIRQALKKCVDNAKGLLKRDETAVKSVFEGLIIGGIAMAFAGVSRPASGVEHYFSHVWDMRGLEFKTKVDLHGIQCAIGTNLASKLYEKVLEITPNKEKALSYAKNFSYESWSKELKEFLGKSADTMIALEQKEGKYDVKKHAQRLDIILKKWEDIRNLILKELPPHSKIVEILNTIGAPLTIEEIGIDCDLRLTLKATKDIRDKYVLSRLLWDLGIIDEIEIN